jgi:tetratricopeptide (TPR) repeat protein
MTVPDPRLRHLRRILLLASVPFAIAALLLVGKLLGLQGTAGPALDSYERGSYATSAEQLDPLFDWNAFEPWIAHFDRGTAKAAAGDTIPAITDLERAFAQAPGAKRCDVAVNLSLSWETLGDSYAVQGQLAGAARLYATAKAVIEAAGPECEPPNAPQNNQEGRDPGQELSDASGRLDFKPDLTAPPSGGGGDDTPSDGQDQLDELREQNDDAAGEKAEREAQNRGEDSGGTFTDRPW